MASTAEQGLHDLCRLYGAGRNLSFICCPLTPNAITQQFDLLTSSSFALISWWKNRDVSLFLLEPFSASPFFSASHKHTQWHHPTTLGHYQQALFQPAWVSAYQLVSVPTSLGQCLPAWVSAYQLVSVPTSLGQCLPAWVSAYQLVSVPTSLGHWQPAA